MLGKIVETIRATIREEFFKHGLFVDSSGEYEQPQVEELILLSHPSCPYCEELEDAIKPAIDSGQVRVVSILSKEGQEISKVIGEDSVPTLVAKMSSGELRKCQMWSEGEDLMIDCGFEWLGGVEEGEGEKPAELVEGKKKQ